MKTVTAFRLPWIPEAVPESPFYQPRRPLWLPPENLVNARKRTPRAEDDGRRVRLFQDYGIQVNGSFVVGFDGDRRDTFTSLAPGASSAAQTVAHGLGGTRRRGRT